MGHAHQNSLLGLILLNLVATCASDCTTDFRDENLNAENGGFKSTNLKVCDVPTFLNVNCTLEENLKSHLQTVINRTFEDLWDRCSLDRLRLFLTKPPANVSITILTNSMLRLDQGINILICDIFLQKIGFKFIEDGAFDSLERLEFVHLQGNYLQTIKNETFRKLVYLRKLDLSKNVIFKLHEGWSDNLQRLRILNLSYNHLSHLSLSHFKSLKNLRELDISGNHLWRIDVSTFKDLKNLIILDLSGNSLDSFYFGTFDNLRTLTTLNISNNKFEMLPLYTFHATDNLENLNFSNNRISDLDLNALERLQFKRVDFRGNQLSCDFLLDLIEHLEKKHIHFIKENITEDDNVYGFGCINSYQTTEDDDYVTYLTRQMSRLSRRVETLSKKLDEVLHLQEKQNTGHN
ncbi:unnamed protein product [Acanthoscelides obtectus]|uniref:Uncharacterized protein n=1 Tax=Acanthoscelides obtectus TaxID=200917 RepID=A0A9P0KRV1_ACAOB|nr:unnamed protein product [Acanthoscelides obtectus]CAK1657213.1 hypothetical protein AOBTE_LOCUS20211 [Acanthoscelides obtectus]